MADVYTIYSIDPGLNSFGCAISTFNTLTKKRIVTHYDTYYPSKYQDKQDRKDARHYHDTLITARHVKTIIQHYLTEYTPDYVCSENAFYNPTRPSAFIGLYAVLLAIEDVLYTTYKQGLLPHMPETSSRLYKMAPTLIKQVVSKGKGGKAIKDDMLHALYDKVADTTLSFLDFPDGDLDPLTFTEHSVDAISVGYAFTELWLPHILQKTLSPYLLSLKKKQLQTIRHK